MFLASVQETLHLRAEHVLSVVIRRFVRVRQALQRRGEDLVQERVVILNLAKYQTFVLVCAHTFCVIGQARACVFILSFVV